MPENFGCKVIVTKIDGSVATFRNVTEIHYNYRSVTKSKDVMLALESDVHNAGLTLFMDQISEFETQLETEKADWF